jgi:sarcosine oxidase subunit gamma
MEEVPFTPAYDVRVEPGTAAYHAVCQALGVELPTRVGDVARSKGAVCLGESGYDASAPAVHALTLGPDWWLVTGNQDIAALLEPLRADHHLSVVDVSAQRTKIELYGPQARNVLGHVWEQDLRPSRFGIDRCSQGLMVKSPVVIWHCCDGADGCYLLFVRSSFARHVWDALTDASVEYL